MTEIAKIEPIAEFELEDVLATYGAHELKIDASGRVYAVTVYSQYELTGVKVKLFPDAEG